MHNTFSSKKEYQNVIFSQFMSAYSRYHPSDILALAISFLDTVDKTDSDEETIKLKNKYKKQIILYYDSMSKGLESWYKILELNKTCEFDISCLDLIQFVRYTTRRTFRYEGNGHKYHKNYIEKYFKEMNAHVLYAVTQIGLRLNLDINAINDFPIPPEITNMKVTT